MSNSSESYEAFSKISNLARELNTQLKTTEIVVTGRKGSGKTSLVNALVGHKILPANHSTKRPVIVTVINNLNAELPIFTLVGDRETNSKRLQAPLQKIQEAIKTANKPSTIPLEITIEIKNCWNFTIIDTPSIHGGSEGDLSEAEIEKVIHSFIKVPERFIISVEEVKHNSENDTLVRKVDPKSARTVFVYNKFNNQLKTFLSHRELNHYLSSDRIHENSFFITLVSNEKNADEQFSDVEKADLVILEQLQYDRRLSTRLGISSLKNYVDRITWKAHQENAPEVLRSLRTLKRKTHQNLQDTKTQIEKLNAKSLRTSASSYAISFLQGIDKLIEGTLEGNPQQNGQTTQEEKDFVDAGDWKDCDLFYIDMDNEDVPYNESKLYGGQQFERLLAEFKLVAQSIDIKDSINSSDVATAVGPLKLNNSSNYAWTASDIAQKESKKALQPLVEQLFHRATYIMKRLSIIVDKMLQNSKLKDLRNVQGLTSPFDNAFQVSSANFFDKFSLGLDQGTLENFKEYPYFLNYVKELYFKFIEEQAEICKSKALDEFYCTQLILWEAMDVEGINLPGVVGPGNSESNTEKSKVAVMNLIHKLFDEIKTRVIKNVMLKTYNFFLVPMQTDLWGEVQGHVTCLSDSMLEELFEVKAKKDHLLVEQTKIEEKIKEYHSLEETLLNLNSQFFSVIS